MEDKTIAVLVSAFSATYTTFLVFVFGQESDYTPLLEALAFISIGFFLLALAMYAKESSDDEGFSLIEPVIVFAIIGILGFLSFLSLREINITAPFSEHIEYTQSAIDGRGENLKKDYE